MGRAITMENRQDELDRRLKLVEDALEELVQNGTRVHHVDLHEDTRNVVAEGTKVEPEETKKSKKTKKETVSA